MHGSNCIIGSNPNAPVALESLCGTGILFMQHPSDQCEGDSWGTLIIYQTTSVI